jgi:hydroxyacylglutathione hydrolase
MASSSETAKAYFSALSDHDVNGALRFWRAGAVDHVAGTGELTAPDELRAFLEELFSAFPDLRFEILETTTQRERCSVRWRMQGTFAGPGRLDGFTANGRRVDCEGADLLTIRDSQIVSNHVYMDVADMLRQLDLLAQPESVAGRRRALLANAGRAAIRPVAGGDAKVIAPGVWIVQGGFPTSMNVYLLEEPGGGVTVFDAGVRSMTSAVAAAAARLGGIRRVVLGHADCDHRGSAAGLGAPVYTHPLEVEAARSPASRREYWNLRELAPTARPLFPLLFRLWDGGALEVAGTVEEGDQIAGFEVIHLPGHAPGLIGLMREEDGLALASDLVYTLNVETSIPGHPRTPHPAFNIATDEARRSILKLAERNPRAVWVGHSRPVAGAEVADQLRRAAER